MTLRSAANLRTICEVLREINDCLQGDPLHVTILPKLREAESMAKRMAKKLFEYNQHFDQGWWEKNKDVAEKLKRRLDESYIS